MAETDDLLGLERTAVERARAGDHDAFVQLYRQDAPPAWRLALALTRDPDDAARAVAEGFRRVLAPTVAPATATEVPFQLRLLTATRHAVLDARPRGAVAASPEPGWPGAARRVPASTVAAMTAFHQLPERWRTVLWLLAVEGLGSAEAARVLDVRPEEAEDLAARARDGLVEQWRQDRARDDAAVPGRASAVVRSLQPLVPLPLTLFDQVERRWRAALGRSAGPLHLTLPGGRPVPMWAERTLVGATGALIALGITGALLADRDTSARRDDPLASVRRGADGDGDGAANGRPRTLGDSSVVVPEPEAYLDGDDGDMARGRPHTIVTIDPLTGEVVAHAVTSPSPTVAAEEPEPSSTTTTTTPLLQVTAGLGPTLGIAAGSQCGGLEILGAVLGCVPDTKDEGLTLEADSALLPGL